MPPDEARLLLFGKLPLAGMVKTRLCPPLDPEEAAMLYRAFLSDVAGEAPDYRYEARFVLWPTADLGFDPGLPCDVQRGENLAERMKNAFADAFADGAARVVIRNTDSPLLPRARISAAFEALGRGEVDVVLGPDDGGGYYLVGLSSPRPELFQDMAGWPAREVFARTIDRARRAGCAILVLREEADVDVPADLERLRTDLAQLPRRARATREALALLDSKR